MDMHAKNCKDVKQALYFLETNRDILACADLSRELVNATCEECNSAISLEIRNYERDDLVLSRKLPNGTLELAFGCCHTKCKYFEQITRKHKYDLLALQKDVETVLLAIKVKGKKKKPGRKKKNENE